jgi:hypothetical protein
MNYDIITIQDCLDAYEMRGWGVIIEDGQVTGFESQGGDRVGQN